MSTKSQKRTGPVRQLRYRERMARNGFVQISLFVRPEFAERVKAEAQAARDEYFTLRLPLVDRHGSTDD